MLVRFLGQEDPLEKEMIANSSIFAWEIQWTEEPGGLQPMGSKESDMTATKQQQQHICLPCFSFFSVVSSFLPLLLPFNLENFL